MKFYSKEDVALFLVEVGRLDLVPTTYTEAFDATEEMLHEFIKNRRRLIPLVKDFRRSQASKEQWRTNRYKYMKGIHGFHKSTAGKRFHRALGRFLATRDTTKSHYRREAFEDIKDVCEALKALSSLRTHAFIKLEYYHPFEAEIDYQLFLEEFLPACDRMENALLDSGKEASADDIDLIIALTDRKALAAELAEKYGADPREVEQYFEEVLKVEDPETSGAYLRALNDTKGVFSAK